ncbi:MAG: hypothetical protein K5745_07220 [Saccharofermentans sp.]|nr:hypothetical protein [Saccharofermentans sp.]
MPGYYALKYSTRTDSSLINSPQGKEDSPALESCVLSPGITTKITINKKPEKPA